MHDTYTSYGIAKLNLVQLCSPSQPLPPASADINAPIMNGNQKSAALPSDGANKSMGGWLTLGEEAGKVLYSAKFIPREVRLPKMFPDAGSVADQPGNKYSPVRRSKDQEGDTDMAEETKNNNNQASPIAVTKSNQNRAAAPAQSSSLKDGNGTANHGVPADLLEDEDGETL